MSESEKLDVKNILELIAALKVLGVLGGKISADGKINAEDLKHLVDAAKEFQVVIDGFKDLDDALKEAKDVDEMEAVQIISELFAAIKAFKESRKV